MFYMPVSSVSCEGAEVSKSVQKWPLLRADKLNKNKSNVEGSKTSETQFRGSVT